MLWDRVSCYICRSHTNNRAFIGSCLANHMAHETLFLQRPEIRHHFWHRNALALLKLQYSWKTRKKTDYLLLSHSIRLQIREMAENVGCISHVIGNKPALLGSLSLIRHNEAATMASAKYRQSRIPPIPPPFPPGIKQNQQLKQRNYAVYQIRCIQPPVWYCNNLKFPLCKTFTQNGLKYQVAYIYPDPSGCVHPVPCKKTPNKPVL